MTLRPDDPYIAKVNKRSYDKQQAIQQLIQRTSKWEDRNRNGQTEISYTFNNGGFNEAQKSEAQRSIESWGDVANLAFTENGGPAEGRLSFAVSSRVRTASGTFPTPNGRGGGVTLYNPRMVHRHLFTHEIGHALGLSHPGDYNGNASESQRVYAQDSTAHTVMSYFSDRSSGKHLGKKPDAPMMDDISAIQQRYGANHETRKGDTTYGFNSNSQRDYYTLNSAHDNAVFCVWDGAGDDTLDFSGYRANQTINLKAGSFSDVGGLQGNVSIARNCTIENAIGGAGHDALIGNDADNRLTGGAGGDQLRGGGGADRFVYNHASDSTPENPDTIMDFTSGTDKIDVSGALKSANSPALVFVDGLTGKAGETLLTYDKKTATGSVSIDLTGNGKPDLLIKTHGQVKAQDIVSGAPQLRVQRNIATQAIPATPPAAVHTTETARFVYREASESSYGNSQILTDFVSGTDKVDLTGVSQEADTPLVLVSAYTGRRGDTVVKYNRRSGKYYIGVDLTGNGRTDFLVRSTRPIRPADILGLSTQASAQAFSCGR